MIPIEDISRDALTILEFLNRRFLADPRTDATVTEEDARRALASGKRAFQIAVSELIILNVVEAEGAYDRDLRLRRRLDAANERSASRQVSDPMAALLAADMEVLQKRLSMLQALIKTSESRNQTSHLQTLYLQRSRVEDAIARTKDQLINPPERGAMAATTAYDVFVSYSTKDASVAEDIAAKLRGRGCTVFLAHQTITVGPRWEDQVADAARSCSVAVLVLSRDSRDSDWVRYEIGALWALGKPVAPALVGPDPADVPELVRRYQGRPASSSEERTALCDELIRLIGKKRDGQQSESGGA